jgi:ABC-type Mn2+/Zn2+ transport system ATPase subunit
MKRTPLIELVDVHHETRSGARLRGVTLQIWPGETVAIRGCAGAGKTTLLWLLAGVVAPARGTRRSSAMTGDGRAFEGVAFLSQRPSFLLSLSVLEHVMVGLLARGLRDHAVIRERATQGLLEAGLVHMASKPMGELCVPERRLVLLAEVLALRAPLVFIDEGYGLSIAKVAAPGRTIVIAARDDVGVKVDRSLGIDVDGALLELDPPAHEAA